MNLKCLFFISIFLFLFSGCSNNQVVFDDSNDVINGFRSASLENTLKQRDLKYQKYRKTKEISNLYENYKYQNSQDFGNFKMGLDIELFDFYTQWEGVKYKLGGDSKEGIDCSGFIQKAFKEKFDLSMPRSTVLQSQVGKEIDKSDLEVGDLVFFKTEGYNHVGIYIENGNFIHASTKNGVTISNLDNSYFSNSYWKAQRIIH